MEMEVLAQIPDWDWPAGTAGEVRAVLEDREAPPAERILAAEMAGSLTILDPSLAEGLLTVLQNPDEEEDLRGRSAIAFGGALEYAFLEGFDDPLGTGFLEEPILTEPVLKGIQSVLRDTYQDPSIPKLVRRRALEASVRAPDSWHTGAIRAAFHDGDPEWRLTAVFCMRFVRGFEEEILEALKTDNPPVLREAILAAGSWEISEAWPLVRRMLRSGHRAEDLAPGNPEMATALILAAIHSAAGLGGDEGLILLENLMAELEDPGEALERGKELDADEEDLFYAVEEALELAYLLARQDQMEMEVLSEDDFPEGDPENQFN